MSIEKGFLSRGLFGFLFVVGVLGVINGSMETDTEMGSLFIGILFSFIVGIDGLYIISKTYMKKDKNYFWEKKK